MSRNLTRSHWYHDGAVQVLSEVRQFEEEHGRRPRMLLARVPMPPPPSQALPVPPPGLGSDSESGKNQLQVASETALLVGIAAGLSDLGFDVDVSADGVTPTDLAMDAMDADVHVIGLFGPSQSMPVSARAATIV